MKSSARPPLAAAGLATRAPAKDGRVPGATLGVAVAALLFAVCSVTYRHASARPAPFASTFIVNSTGDAPDSNLGDGLCSTGALVGVPPVIECTLRAAIQQANADAIADTIAFDILVPAAGVRTISPASPLPAVTQPVTIDGYTQPGTLPNSLAASDNAVLLIELNGTSAGAGADGLQIATTSTTLRGLIINRFGGDGVELSGAAGQNTVAGNFIGADSAGTADLGNAGSGVRVSAGSTNTVGGSAPADRNVISGNDGDGVTIAGAGASGNSVLGNFIGADKGGTADLGNTLSGVSIATSGNQIGDATTTPGQGAGNVISGNDAHGVAIVGAGTNEVQGNLIGLQSGGAAARANALDGVNVTGAAAGNTIGGAAPGLRNIISSNGSDGVELNGAGVTGTLVGANYIGASSGGTADLGNASNGVLIAGGATSNTVGGLTSSPGSSPGNIISGNQSDGVEINNSNSNIVLGNLIGLQSNGLTALRNEGNGVFISSAASNTVGGYTATARNVISAHNASGTTDGVDIVNTASVNNKVIGNYIGTGVGGTETGLGNGGDGVRVAESADNNIIGGDDDDDGTADAVVGARNVIGNNAGDGVEINGSGATGNVVAGNYIGIDKDGVGDIGNTANGVLVSAATGNTIGGSTATPGTSAGNVISGNNGDGVELSGNADSNLVRGNLIGLRSDGAGAVPNVANGVLLSGVISCTVGGATSDLRNVISGNLSDGVEIAGTASVNNVQGNYIGTQTDGLSALANVGHGVLISANTNTVGGTVAGAGNTIAFNGGDGVYVSSGTANAIRRNSIHSNIGLGIDLGADGVTLNDLDDPDTGANNLQNFPLIIDARTGSTVITGTLNSTPSTTFTIEFFYSAVPDPTAHGEGQNYLDSISVTTDAGGDAAFTHTATTTAPLGNVITATATNPAGNTSEFSRAHVVLAPTLSRLREFEATLVDGAGVALAWRTELEIDNLGFRLYREEAGERTLITPSLVAGSALAVGPGTALTAGGSYTWTDAAGTPASRYWLEDVDADGVGTRHGPFWPTSVSMQTRRQKKPRTSALLEQIGATQGGGSPQRGWAAQASVEGQSSSSGGGGVVEGQSDSTGAGNVAASGITGPAAPEPDYMPADGVERQRVLAAGAAVKLSVRLPGWYRVTRAQLEAAGLSPSADPAYLQLFAEGVEQAIHVNASAWAQNGVVEFYGEGLDTISADTRVYWLIVGTTPGRRTSSAPQGGGKPRPPKGGHEPQPAASTAGANGGVKPPPSFDYTVERRDRSVYYSALLNGEGSNFFGGVITPNAPAQALTVRGLRPADAVTARLEVRLQGVTAGPHSVRVMLNGAEVGQLAFADRENKAAAFDVSPTLLLEGDNALGLTSAAPSDVSLTDYIRVTYRRAYRAEADQLNFTAEGGAVTRVTGFTTANIRVVDITERGSVTEVVATVESVKIDEGGGYAVRFTPGGTGRRTLLAFAGGAVSAVDGTRVNQPSQWYAASNAADFVIVTHADFRAAATTLAERRVSEGLATTVVDVEDLYDEFSYGAHTPKAVRDFLVRAHSTWQRAPRYVLLVGDGSYDPRNHLGRGLFDFVPARLIDTSQMETSSDEWLADFDGDGLAEMAVGRLPVRTANEAALVVSKIVGHAPGTAERRLLLVSDRRGADGFDFEAATSSLLAHVPAGYETQRIDRGARDAATVRAEIVGGVNSGPALVNYVGHGAVGVWTGEGLLRSSDALALSNGARLPLFAMMTCLNGYYIDPSLDSLSESLLKAEHGGALAAWSSTGMTTPEAQAEMNRALYRALFESTGTLRLGDALRAARSSTANPDVRRTWVLLGDPTTKWR
ncbi:MAG TPA: C25 family cysteine peptidase [Pyrinomonadaceae bacterium]